MTLEVTALLGDPRIRNSPRGRFGPADLIAIEKMHSALSSLKEFRVQFVNEHRDLPKNLRSSPPDFVLNLCDSGFRNDPKMEAHIPALLDMLGIPYSGAAPACLATCYDKALVRCLAQTLGIPVAREIYFPPNKPFDGRSVPLPALIKAACSDGSIGVIDDSIAASGDDARSLVTHFRNTMPGQPLLVQEFLTGREYSVGVIGNLATGLDVLPILEGELHGLGHSRSVIAHSPKRDAGTAIAKPPRYSEASISADSRRRLGEYAATLFERLGCRDYACVDFRADHLGEIRLLAVKPNPAWCWDGKLAAMARFRGLGYADMFRMILDAALTRIGRTDVRRRESFAA